MNNNPTYKQRLAEAGTLLVKNLKAGTLTLRNHNKALKDAKRNLRKYNAAARMEYVKLARVAGQIDRIPQPNS